MKEINGRCGALLLADGACRWRVWAPFAQQVFLLLEAPLCQRAEMKPSGNGYYELELRDVEAGQRYRYSLDNECDLPDPASSNQPDGLWGASAVLDTRRFAWSDSQWQGFPRGELVIYELHVGTFTAEGTFDAIIQRLDALRELGITAIELMPIAQFPGTRNWGYDGVLPYAAQHSYGGPLALQRLINQCHTKGMAVFLDVVYNHFGPEGSNFQKFGPYFTDRYRTPWGAAINFDGPDSDAVREYFLHNVRYWLEEFHFDGLRLDAVHSIFDFGARHILEDIKATAEDVAKRSGRHIQINAESDLNDPRLLLSRERGGYAIDGQWADDFHHAVHSYLTGERRGYYADFGAREQVANAMSRPFLYAGSYSHARRRRHGAPAVGLPAEAFVVCLQNHDQIGNRPCGERLSALLSPNAQRLAVSLLLLSPYIPLIFMGEEYGESKPFLYFCSFESADLIENVRKGRQLEFRDFVWEGDLADPHDEQSFLSSTLAWNWLEGTPHASMRNLYQVLIALRREWPALKCFDARRIHLRGELMELTVQDTGKWLVALFNLGQDLLQLDQLKAPGELILSSEERRFGGHLEQLETPDVLQPYECLIFRSYQ